MFGLMGMASQTAPPPAQYVYHESQISRLCGLHCLNNLCQGPYFDVGLLGGIAADLDAAEAKLVTGGLKESVNVDEAGNFSISVLRKALETLHSATLNSANEKVEAALRDPTSCEAYVLNHHDHWFAIRKLHGRFWDLNSMLKRPKPVTDFYMAAYLAQMRGEGYSIFVVEPAAALPPAPRSAGFCPASRLLTVASLLVDDAKRQREDRGAREATAQEATADPELAAAIRASQAHADREAAAGRQPGSSASSLQHQGGAAAAGGGEDDEEEQLRLAMALSLSSGSSSASSSASSSSAAHAPAHGGFTAEELAAARARYGDLEDDLLVAMLLSERDAAPPSPGGGGGGGGGGDGSSGGSVGGGASPTTASSSSSAATARAMATTLPSGMLGRLRWLYKAQSELASSVGAEAEVTQVRVRTLAIGGGPGRPAVVSVGKQQPAAVVLARACVAQAEAQFPDVDVVGDTEDLDGAMRVLSPSEVAKTQAAVLEAAAEVQRALGFRLSLGVGGRMLLETVRAAVDAGEEGSNVPTVEGCGLCRQSVQSVPL